LIVYCTEYELHNTKKIQFEVPQNGGDQYYDTYTGTYFLHDEEWEEPMEFTEDELVEEGIYLNEFCQRV
jgi:hypothetical protein